MKQLSLAVLQYNQDNDEQNVGGPGYNYNGNGGSWCDPLTMATWGQGWAVQIYPYVKSAGAYKCPDDPTPANPAITTDNCGNPDPANGKNNSVVSYGINKNLCGQNLPGLAGIQSPARTVLFWEEQGNGQVDFNNPIDRNSTDYRGTENFDGPPYARIDSGQWYHVAGDKEGQWVLQHFEEPNTTTLIPGLHNGAANYAFADGHVKYLQSQTVSGGWDSQAADCYPYSYTGAGNDPACATGGGTGYNAAGTDVTQDATRGNAPINATMSSK
jgi:prepilin-type processing-associated H-X9-DG protein